jgi:hypothetical protein
VAGKVTIVTCAQALNGSLSGKHSPARSAHARRATHSTHTVYAHFCRMLPRVHPTQSADAVVSTADGASVDFTAALPWLDGTQLVDNVQRVLTGQLTADFRFRGLVWKILLGVLPIGDVAALAMPRAVRLLDWDAQLSAKRVQYDELKARLMAVPADVDTGAGDDPLLDNPLQFSEESAWGAYHRSRSLLAEIHKDVERLYPDGCGTFFQTEDMQKRMADVLFLWCQLHEQLSYRQVRRDTEAPVCLCARVVFCTMAVITSPCLTSPCCGGSAHADVIRLAVQ